MSRHKVSRHKVTRPPRLYPRLTLLSLGLFLVGTNAFVIAGLLPDIAASLHVADSDVSYSITFYALVVAIAAPTISIAASRLSRTTLMATGLVLIAAGTTAAALATTIDLFTVGRVVAGVGGAAVVPASTAAAAALAPEATRGRAIAFVAVGFTAATALGAPLGTAVGSVAGWQVPLLGVALLALLLAGAEVLLLRGLPISAPARLAQRLAPLRDARVVLTLVTTLLIFVGFNVVYIFSAGITAPATGGSGNLLAILLMCYGAAGTLGTLGSGRLTDRYGNARVATCFLLLHVAVLLTLPWADHSYPATAALFVLWGIASFGASLPIQHRLSAIDPPTAPLALSWYATAMYGGIAVAPVLGASVLNHGGSDVIPYAGAGAVLLALVTFRTGLRRRRSARPPTTATVIPARQEKGRHHLVDR